MSRVASLREDSNTTRPARRGEPLFDASLLDSIEGCERALSLVRSEKLRVNNEELMGLRAERPGSAEWVDLRKSEIAARMAELEAVIRGIKNRKNALTASYDDRFDKAFRRVAKKHIGAERFEEWVKEAHVECEARRTIPQLVGFAIPMRGSAPGFRSAR